MRNSIIFLICIILLVTIVSASYIPIYVKPLDSSGNVQPNTAFTYNFSFSTTSNCNNIIFSNLSVITTDNTGIGFLNLTVPDNLQAIPTYLCEYKNSVLRKVHALSAQFFERIYGKSINVTDNIHSGGNISTTSYFIGNASLLYGFPKNLTTLAWNNISTFPTSCSSGQVVVGIGSTLTCINLVNSTTLSISNITNFNYNYNQSLPYNKWYYNQSTAVFTLYNSTWDNSYMNIWNYNQTSAVGDIYVSRTDWTTHDDYPSDCSSGEVAVGIGDTLTCISLANASTLSINNITNFLYNYNQTTGAYNIYGSNWYNHTSEVNTLWGQWFYNQTSTSDSTYNATYHNYAIANYTNKSNFWDNLNTINTTQIEDNGGILNILESWLTTFFDALFGGKTTDDLTQGTTNLYDNQSWNETYAEELYAGIEWGYNFTTETFNLYNSTWDNSFLNIWGYNETVATYNLYNASWSSTYNVTYAGSLNNASYLSTYNSTYDAKVSFPGWTNVAWINQTNTFALNLTLSDELIMSDNKNIYMGSNRIYSNITCIIIKGSSATLEIC